MHQEGSRIVAEQEDETDRALLAVLLDDGSPMWSIEELVRFMGNRIDVADSLARLYRAGLLHRLEGFVFASQVARRAAELIG